MSPSTFDIMHQTFNLTDFDGQLIEQETDGIQVTQNLAVNTAIVFGTQLGLTAAVLAIMLITASSAKIRTIIFWLNTSALTCNIVRCTLQCALMNGPISNFLVIVLNAWTGPAVERAIIMSITCTVFTFCLFVCIQSSLIVQVGVIFSSGPRHYRNLALCSVSLIGLVAVAWRINLAIANIKATIYVADNDTKLIATQTLAQLIANITTIISLGTSSAIFAGKVAYLIHKRRDMGLKAFGKLQIVFIISCQTLVLPVIIAAVACFVLKGAQLQSFVETLIAVFLPLSSIWSSANVQAQVSNSHPTAMLQLPSYHSDGSLLISRASKASIAAAQQLDHPVRRERSVWEQYGSRDSVMLEDLDLTNPITTAITCNNPVDTDRSPSNNAIRAETSLYFLDLAHCEKGLP